MAKNRKNDIDSFSGMFKGISEPEQTVNEEKEKHITTGARKRGRPKLNRETKKRISFTILPSLYEKASEIAYNEGKSVSELIADLLTKYVEEHS